MVPGIFPSQLAILSTGQTYFESHPVVLAVCTDAQSDSDAPCVQRLLLCVQRLLTPMHLVFNGCNLRMREPV